MDALGIRRGKHAGARRRPPAVVFAAIASVVFMTFCGAPPAKALVINVDAPGLAGSDALAAFERAAATWERTFTDPVEVNISASLQPLGSPMVIGQTTSLLLEGSYTTVRNAMVADGLAERDDGIVDYLPDASQFTATVLGLDPNRVFSLSGGLSATKANLKALGFGGLDTQFGAIDGFIDFNSMFDFDFDRSDGVAAGSMDFETVAAHEIGHVLGFDSVVDSVDVLAFLGVAIPISPRTLDLFRFQEGNAPTTPQEFTNAERLLVPGLPVFDPFGNIVDQFPAVFSDVDNTYPLSTGVFLGDGRQASHWKDDDLAGLHVGLMDPSLALGEVFELSAADIRALDLIGWDYQPAVSEPSSVLLAAVALLAVFFFFSRTRELARE